MSASPLRWQDIQAITFDCYGTLIDWEGGAKETLRALLEKNGAARNLLQAQSLHRFFQAWERAQRDRIQRSYKRYRQIAADSLLEVAAILKLPLGADEARAFADSIGAWKPFPDVPAALPALKRRVRLGIISNIDDDILAASREQMGVEFDLLMTAEQVRAYKPSPVPFQRALERLGLPVHRVAHAAFGFEYDIVTASGLGFRTILVRRARSRFPAQPVPDLSVRDLAELAAQVA